MATYPLLIRFDTKLIHGGVMAYILAAVPLILLVLLDFFSNITNFTVAGSGLLLSDFSTL